MRAAPLQLAGVLVRGVAAAHVLRNVLRAARRVPPITTTDRPVPTISVVVPARDEATRIGPLLAAVRDAPGVHEVLVVDDESRDATAAVADAAGARVVTGRPPPPGWAGKAWALQQGLDEATGEWIVFLDADARPAPELPAALVARAEADGLEVACASGCFELPSAGARWLHPALLTTLVYRFPPPGARDQGPVGRRLGNGQCLAVRAVTLRAAGGFRPVAHHTVEDVALVRMLATAGFAVASLDAGRLLTVRAYESAGDAWRNWGRSLALPGVDGPARRLGALVVLATAQAAPLVRLVARRADLLDVALLAVRGGTLVGTARAYRPRGLAYWLSPLADPVAVAALVRSTLTRPRPWRGRPAP
jgi:dolichol-phosphate mannosyltransferase